MKDKIKELISNIVINSFGMNIMPPEEKYNVEKGLNTFLDNLNSNFDLIYRILIKIIGINIYSFIVIVHIIIFILIMWIFNIPFYAFWNYFYRFLSAFGFVTLFVNITIPVVITTYFTVWYGIIFKLLTPWIVDILFKSFEKHFLLEKHLLIAEK